LQKLEVYEYIKKKNLNEVQNWLTCKRTATAMTWLMIIQALYNINVVAFTTTEIVNMSISLPKFKLTRNKVATIIGNVSKLKKSLIKLSTL
jgi:hypothetical protein